LRVSSQLLDFVRIACSRKMKSEMFRKRKHDVRNGKVNPTEERDGR
jgi:hypothetical protein